MHKEPVACRVVIEVPFGGILGLCPGLKEKES
jgi:hypothetical protein